jgi:hypothetical protein
VGRAVYEDDFLRLLRLLTVKPEMLDLMTQLAVQAKAVNPREDGDFETKKAAAIAKCQRRIEAARHLYEDGDLSRQEYLRRREQNEREIIHWQTYTTETKKLAVEFAMCVDLMDKIVRLWDAGSDEDKQGMVRHLFERIVYDLDRQQIVDFELKPWASRFLILRHALYQNGGDGGQAADKNKKGTKGRSSPVGSDDNHLKKLPHTSCHHHRYPQRVEALPKRTPILDPSHSLTKAVNLTFVSIHLNTNLMPEWRTSRK